MAEIDVLKAQIVRNDLNTPWGFRLEGGTDRGSPLHITRITPGSPAAKIGLKNGDEVTEVDDIPTENLTHHHSMDLISQHGDTICLTVERRVGGAIPVHPVINQASSPDHMKGYQTYDMTGATPAPRHPPNRYIAQVPVEQNYDFQTAVSRPFEAAPISHYQQPPPPPHQPQPQQHSPPQYSPQYQQHVPSGSQLVSEDDKVEEGIPQSRTFRVLQSLMHNEGPAVGVSALPPPRSASSEQWKREQAMKRAGNYDDSPRVKVFMPQQYNSPMGMYSAQNVVETFQAQAETVMDEMERRAVDDGY